MLARLTVQPEAALGSSAVGSATAGAERARAAMETERMLSILLGIVGGRGRMVGECERGKIKLWSSLFLRTEDMENSKACCALVEVVYSLALPLYTITTCRDKHVSAGSIYHVGPAALPCGRRESGQSKRKRGVREEACSNHAAVERLMDPSSSGQTGQVCFGPAHRVSPLVHGSKM